VKYLSLLLFLLTASCTAHHYTVCRGEDYCTPGLTHEEAIRASELKKTWQDDKLYVRPVKNWGGIMGTRSGEERRLRSKC
jgi:hypothetical protein